MLNYLQDLIEIAKKKQKLDQNGSWSDGSATYLAEIRKELSEVEEEIEQGRRCYLEDELGDVLWDYLNILLALEKEQDISLESVFRRSLRKFDQRVSTISQGGRWQDIKTIQKNELAKEYLKETQSSST